VERDESGSASGETWVETLYRDPGVREEIVREVRDVAEEVAAEPAAGEDLGPDESVRSRFRAFARETLDE
jgi:hypothetical protein